MGQKKFLNTIFNQKLILISTIFFSIPIVVTTVFGYEVPLTMLLLPLVYISMIYRSYSIEWYLFITSLCCGLISCLVGELIHESDIFWNPFFSLTLILIPPSFIFLGQQIVHRGYDYKVVIKYLAFFSSVFSIALLARVLLLDEPVRIEIEAGMADVKIGSNINASFIGLPVFGSWGVLSLAHLFCIQAFICLGTFLNSKTPLYIRITSGVGLISLICLIVGSDAKSAQLGILWLAIAYLLFTFRSSAIRLFITICLISVVGVLIESPKYFLGESRLEQLIVNSISGESVSDLSTGRTDIIGSALQDIGGNPMVGVGFGTFNRFKHSATSEFTSSNSSTHIYLLTMLWKGGLLFAIPFLTMLFFVAVKVWKRHKNILITSEGYFALNAILVSFFLLSMTWDILIVPSAGALIFFLFGMLSAVRMHAN